jgi:predicted NAD/FAD-dependent oxidoreductase
MSYASLRVAVIGAGIAGLAAARRCAAAGREVVVFDKARGVGGRTATRRHGEDAFDHGAQYFSCRGEAFERQAEDWRARDVAAVWDAPIVRLEAGRTSPVERETIRYVGMPRMSVLARDLATGLYVELGTRIEAVEQTREGWSLCSKVGTEFAGFDAVVVATPATQAVPLLRAAPALADLAAGVSLLPCQAVMVTFAAPLEVAFGGAFVSRSPLGWVARNASKPGRPKAECWVLHATPEWSTEHLEASPEEVAEQLLSALATTLGRALPPVTFRSAHRWRFARTAASLSPPCLWDAEAAIGVCGDWTHGSRVEDAFTSGEALAQALIACPTTYRTRGVA